MTACLLSPSSSLFLLSLWVGQPSLTMPVRYAVTLKFLEPLRHLSRWLLLYIALCASFRLSFVAHLIQPISPATLIYAPQDSFLAVLLSPFLLPSPRAVFARLLHVSWICMQSNTPSYGFDRAKALQQPTQLLFNYFSLLAVRSVVGFLLTRSVGWVYPRLLNPYALYEQIYGIGPLLMGTVLFGRLPAFSSTGNTFAHGVSSPSKGRLHDMLTRSLTAAVFSMADGLPWTYLCAAGIAGALRVGSILGRDISRRFRSSDIEDEYSSIPIVVSSANTSDDEDLMGLPPPSPHPRANLNALRYGSKSSKLGVLGLSLFAMIACWVSGNAPSLVSRLHRADLEAPSATHQGSTRPDLHIIMLTVPRERDLTDDFMTDNIQSYVDAWDALPLTSRPDAALTVYGHVGPLQQHPAFERAKAVFSTDLHSSPLGLHPQFYMHPHADASRSHYAHLADALRYAYASVHEWTMVVEDDFELCGAWGMRGVSRVVSALGSTLVPDTNNTATEVPHNEILDGSWWTRGRRPARWRGAFVGTGGRYVQVQSYQTISQSDSFR